MCDDLVEAAHVSHTAATDGLVGSYVCTDVLIVLFFLFLSFN